MENYDSEKLINKYLDLLLLKKYLDEVILANRRFNLFSRKLGRADLRLMVAESLIPIEVGWLDKLALPWLDIGSGWGIPAIPLTMACPRIDMTLMERSQKKADFLSLLLQRLKIKAKILTREPDQLDKSMKYAIFTLRRIAVNVKMVKNIKKIALPDARMIYFGSRLPQSLLTSVQSIDYKIDQLDKRSIYNFPFK